MIAFEYLYNRRVPLIYVCPAVCEFDFSGTGEPTIYLAPIRHLGAPTGFLYGGVGHEFRFSWNVVPGALCYSVYRSIDEHNPYGAYQLVAECLSDAYFDIDTAGELFCYRVEAITLDGTTGISEPICPSNEDIPEPPPPPPPPHPPPPPPPHPPPSSCSQVGNMLPDTWRLPTSDVLATQEFTTFSNTELEVTIPPGMGGVYQFRYVSGAQGATCSFSPPTYEWYAMAFGEWSLFVNGVDTTVNWFADDWIPNMLFHNGWSGIGNYVIQRTSDPPRMLWESTVDGDIDDATVENEFHNGAFDPDYQQFCFESPGSVSPGTVLKLGLYQEWYVACSGRPNMVAKSNGPTFELTRVAKYPASPTSVSIVGYPGYPSIPMTTYSQSDLLWEFSVANALGFCLLRGNCIVGKWQLFLPWPGGGWTGEKLYGDFPTGNYQRTSPAGPGVPDCLVVV